MILSGQIYADSAMYSFEEHQGKSRVGGGGNEKCSLGCVEIPGKVLVERSCPICKTRKATSFWRPPWERTVLVQFVLITSPLLPPSIIPHKVSPPIWPLLGCGPTVYSGP